MTEAHASFDGNDCKLLLFFTESARNCGCFFLLAIQFVSALMRYGEFINDLRQYFHALVERSERYALIVSMHAFQIIW